MLGVFFTDETYDKLRVACCVLRIAYCVRGFSIHILSREIYGLREFVFLCFVRLFVSLML